MIRFLILLLNVTIIAFLVYELIRVYQQPMDKRKKIVALVGGVFLLLSPFAMFVRFIPFSFQYLLIYPLAVGVYIYYIRNL